MPESDAPIPTRNTQRTAARPWRDWLAVFGAALILYALTANRGAQWQDSGQHILRIVTGESIHPLGLALSHPLHHWIGRAVASLPQIEPCFAITLISAFAAAVTVANTFGCVVALTGRRGAALFACASLGLANTFWSMATITETYTLTTALLSAECWCVIKYLNAHRPRHLVGAWLFNGLGISNHMLGGLTSPILLVVTVAHLIKRRLRLRVAIGAAAVWFVGASLYLWLIAYWLLLGHSWNETLRSALFGNRFAGDVLNVSLSSGLLAVTLGFVVLNFPNLLLPLAAYGLFRGRGPGSSPATRRVLIAALVIHLVFVLRYSVIDQYTFFLPSYLLLALFGGLGFAQVIERPGRVAGVIGKAAVALLILTPVVYMIVPTVARHFDVLRNHQHHKPYRDDYEYLFVPWSVTEDSADRMSREALALAGDRGLILVEDGMASFAVRYRVIRAAAKLVAVRTHPTPGLIEMAIEQHRPIVLVPRNADAPDTPLPAGSWERVGDLYRWVPGG